MESFKKIPLMDSPATCSIDNRQESSLLQTEVQSDSRWSMSTTTKIFFIITCTLAALLLYKKYLKFKEFAAKVDALPGKRRVPLIGNVLILLANRKRIFQLVTKDIATRGPVVRAWVLNKAQVVITRARIAEPILKNSIFINKSDLYTFLHDFFGLGLVTAPDSLWQIHRKILNPAFSIHKLTEYLPIFNKHALRFVDKISKLPERNNGFDICPFVSISSLNIICESTMGVELNDQDNSHKEIVLAVNIVTDLINYRYISPWLHFNFLFQLSPTKREMDKQAKVFRVFIDKVIEERKNYFNVSRGELKQHLNQNEDDDTLGVLGVRRRLSLLDVLLTAEREGVMNQKEIKDHVTTFMSAGYDTIATTMSFVFFLLGTYPDIQSRVVNELDAIFGETGRCPDKSDLANMKYLERCIKETMRLYPVVFFFERDIPQDVQADEYLIPSGCKVSFITYTLHRDPEFWPDPEKFDPDRFLPENCEGRHPYAYIPFSAGPRNCIGQKFAMLEAKIFLSTVLRRFRVESVEKRNKLRLKIGITLKSETGIQLRLYDRESHPNLRVTTA